ncbi:uncharacterized protein isoform X3 [Musca autumnalis]|uniref:uncharacterized protein isoform X3 n=1 Tax=Musca autumnalis TaxID=221902 RepID=UPI003CF24155
MNLHNPTLMLGFATLLVFCWIETSVAFPSLVMPRMHRSMDNELGVQNKIMGFPQTDDDVFELEQLRDVHPEQPISYSHQQNSDTLVAEEPQPLVMADETLPGLEQQLESATPQLQSTQGPQVPAESAGETPPESASNGGEQPKSFGHRPPTLQIHDGGKTDGNGEKPKAKTAESLLKHNNGQYSSFDMAQYVFWTGDEAGVARAVEELIQQDMMSREDALKFLHEIRVGIEYLQKSYANRIFPEEIHHNTVKKSFITKPSTTTSTTTTTTTTTTTPKPDLQYLNFEQNLEEPENLNLGKALDNIALWHKLQAMNQGNQDRQDTGEDESETRRPKIADCDHKEYNLEEIIYKLARIMFTESLTHGDEAQREIKKLMDFFEREHELGVIPLDLEQKVIHVLLQALSDTLTEKPELWPAAQYPYNRLLRSYAHTNYMRPSSTNV